MLPDGSEAGRERLCTSRIAKALHVTFASARGLITVLGAVAHPRRGLHEQMLHCREFSDRCLGRRVAAQLVGDDSLPHGHRAQHASEEAFLPPQYRGASAAARPVPCHARAPHATTSKAHRTADHRGRKPGFNGAAICSSLFDHSDRSPRQFDKAVNWLRESRYTRSMHCVRIR